MTWPMTVTGLLHAGAVSKPHHYKQNVQKMKGLLKKRAWTENSLKFSGLKAKISTPPMENKTKDPQEPKGKAEHEPCRQEEINWSEIEKKAFRRKLFELCKTRTKKSSPDLFNFYVISARHDMAIDAGRATTCRRSFKAPSLQTKRTKNEGASEKTSFNGEQFEIFKPKSQKLQSSNGKQNKRTTRPQGKNWTWNM